MESQKLDIVELIESNPITRLSKDYQGKFIEKVQQNFTESQQQLFIASFYTYLNYDSENDFVIEVESIWKYLGFGRKEECKRVLTKNFIQDIDYKILKGFIVPQVSGTKKETRGGYNKEKILMNIDTFKLLCLKSNTKKADDIHKYFIKLEKITLETITEESVELRLQLQSQNKDFIKEKQQILLDSYNQKCIVYLIKIKNNLYKFGHTDNIKRRFTEHKREISNDIELIYCLESRNNVRVENDFKEYLKSTDLRKEEIFNEKIQTELIQTNDIKMIQNVLEKINKPINEYIEILKKEILELKNENDRLKQESTIVQTQTIIFTNRISTEESRMKERERYQKRKVTEQYKKTRQEYNKKNKDAIKERETNLRRKKSKTTFIKTDEEKTKFKNWLDSNVTQQNNEKLVWWTLLDKYLGYRTNALVSKVYKEHFITYTTDKFVSIKTKYVQFKVNKINVKGYRNFSLVI